MEADKIDGHHYLTCPRQVFGVFMDLSVHGGFVEVCICFCSNALGYLRANPKAQETYECEVFAPVLEYKTVFTVLIHALIYPGTLVNPLLFYSLSH